MVGTAHAHGAGAGAARECNAAETRAFRCTVVQWWAQNHVNNSDDMNARQVENICDECESEKA